MDSESERACTPIVKRHRPTRIDGPAQNGSESGLASSQGANVVPHGLRWRARSSGFAKRTPGTGELTAGSPWRSIRGAGANRMHTSAGLPEKPTSPGKPADTLTQARWVGR